MLRPLPLPKNIDQEETAISCAITDVVIAIPSFKCCRFTVSLMALFT